MKIRFLLISIMMFSLISWSQTIENQCVDVTEGVLKQINIKNIDEALGFFSTPSEINKNEIIKAHSRIEELNSFVTINRKMSETKRYFIDRCVYNNESNKAQLIINFYYKKNKKRPLIEKIEVKDKYYLESLPKRKSIYRGRPNIGVPPASNNINN